MKMKMAVIGCGSRGKDTYARMQKQFPDRLEIVAAVDPDPKKLLEMIPGAKGNISEEDLHLEELEKEKAIIRSMTRFERSNYRIIGPSRRKRIAKGSGTSVAEVNRLLKKFEKSRLMMKKVMTNKKLQAAMLKQFGM